MTDGGVDAGLECDELPAPGGEVGGNCRGETLACNTGLDCIPEQTITLGTPEDMIENYPPGTLDVPVFIDGYCTLPDTGVGIGCDPTACAAECGRCSAAIGVCLNACRPEVDTNSTCRDGYTCDLLQLACFPGCGTDDECRINNDLVYNPDSSATCSPVTFRCEHEGMPGVAAGAPCTFDDDCETNGSCLSAPGGYCSKFGCDVAGNECAGDGTCVLGVCYAPCVVGSDTTTPPPTNTQGCRDGYTCYWDRATPNPDGFCDIGTFNPAIDTSNIGDPCTESTECYSPYGYGQCNPAGLEIGCTVTECGAPGVPEDICGDEALCVDFIDAGVDLFACLKTCAAAEGCNPGDACIDLDGNDQTMDDFVCFPACLTSDECRTGEVCDVNNQCISP
jgi:hypothetical protein